MQPNIIELTQAQISKLSLSAKEYLDKKIDTKLARALKVKIEPQLIAAQEKYARKREDICQKYAATDENSIILKEEVIRIDKNGVTTKEPFGYKFKKEDQAKADKEINDIYFGIDEKNQKYKILPFYTDAPLDITIDEIIAFRGIVLDPELEICSDEYLLNPEKSK